MLRAGPLDTKCHLWPPEAGGLRAGCFRGPSSRVVVPWGPGRVPDGGGPFGTRAVGYNGRWQVRGPSCQMGTFPLLRLQCVTLVPNPLLVTDPCELVGCLAGRDTHLRHGLWLHRLCRVCGGHPVGEGDRPPSKHHEAFARAEGHGGSYTWPLHPWRCPTLPPRPPILGPLLSLLPFLPLPPSHTAQTTAYLAVPTGDLARAVPSTQPGRKMQRRRLLTDCQPEGQGPGA